MGVLLVSSISKKIFALQSGFSIQIVPNIEFHVLSLTKCYVLEKPSWWLPVYQHYLLCIWVLFMNLEGPRTLPTLCVNDRSPTLSYVEVERLV